MIGRTVKCIRPLVVCSPWASLDMDRRVRVMVTLQLGMTTMSLVLPRVVVMFLVLTVTRLFLTLTVGFALLLNLFRTMSTKSWPTVWYTTQDRTVFEDFISVFIMTSRLPDRAKLTTVVV